MHTVIIGGTRGLGREVARSFGAANHSLSIVGRREPSDADAGLANARFWQADLCDAPTAARTCDEIAARGPINYLVLLQRFKGEGDQWAGELATSVALTRTVIERLAPAFAVEGDKSIVLVGSIASRFISASQPVGYHVAKGALVQLARYYAVTLGGRRIRVNCVSPSTFVKDENEDYYRNKNAALTDLFAHVIPLGRIGTARDSAGVVTFLCSPAAAFVTGQEFLVDGGVSLLSQEALARALTNL